MRFKIKFYSKSLLIRTRKGEIEFVDELPKTISGKIKRKALRTREF